MPVVTPSGNEAQVPVCAACGEGLEQGQMPDVRRVSQRGMVLHDLFTPDVTDHGGWGGGDFGGGDFGGGTNDAHPEVA